MTDGKKCHKENKPEKGGRFGRGGGVCKFR